MAEDEEFAGKQQVYNDWLIERDAYEPYHPKLGYGQEPMSDAEPLIDLSVVRGYLDPDDNPDVAAMIRRAKAEVLREAVDKLSYVVRDQLYYEYPVVAVEDLLMRAEEIGGSSGDD